MKKNLWIFIAILSLFASRQALADDGVAHASSTGACSSRESWKFPKTIRADFTAEFNDFLAHKEEPVTAFSQGIMLRKLAQSDEARAFSEYWISRALYEAKLPHIAFQGFSAVASVPVNAALAGSQFAALRCMMAIQGSEPSFKIPETVAVQLGKFIEFAQSASSKETLWKVAFEDLEQLLALEKPPTSAVETALAALKGSDAYLLAARGLWHAKKGENRAAAHDLENFFQASSVPDFLQRYQDHLRLVTARSYYGIGNFDQAIFHFKQISKSSNEIAEAISELSWAYLMADRYNEAVGTGMSLQSGGLRHTFAPEAPMVVAMALNEICQYPDSVKAISVFRKGYEDSYKWLAHAPKDLYPIAVQFIRGQGKGIPDKVASEWIKSPLFLSTQNEINLLFQERTATKSLSKSGALAQKKISADILKLAGELKEKIHKIHEKKKDGGPLPDSVVADLVTLKRMILNYHRLSMAAPTWRKILAHYEAQVPAREKKLVARINSDLDKRSKRMLEQIDEVSENIQLVEVEIYQGASEDIIWQNAHPDYQEIAKGMKDDRAVATKDKVWNWGRAPAMDDSAEVWEDEMGAFKANLFDNCESKDRYLALRVRGRNKGSQ